MIPENLRDAFRSTLLSGGYNLLVGSGISLDSTNGQGETLRSAEQLRRDLCALKGVRDTTTLPRVYSLLSDTERKTELLDRFNNCVPGPSLGPMPHFLWRRLFSFNIDDAVEALYRTAAEAKQQLVPLNFDASFEPTPDRQELHAVHLHGWVGRPDVGFVFSHAEYARVMAAMNPWMHLLSEILATESFIIAGTSLNEVDLEYYLSHRSEATPRRGRGPSLLIEPFPDAATESDCKRYGLELVKATFGEFLGWLRREFPAPPTLTDLIVPNVAGLFPDRGLSLQLLKFFADFRLVSAGDRPRSQVPSAFLYGRAPVSEDLDQHIDIARIDTGPIRAEVEQMLTRVKPDGPRLLIVWDDAGTGKTTVIHRVGHDLARSGNPVLALHTLSRIDVKAATDCIASATTALVLLVDGLADHAEQVFDLIEDSAASANLVVLASERAYRQEFVDLVLGDLPRSTRALQPLNQSERRQLIELFRQYGLVGTPAAVKNPDEYGLRLKGDAVAVAVCRILNDFRPLESIVESLWTDTPEQHRLAYLSVALARHCHAAGIRYSILQSIVGTRTSLDDLFSGTAPLAVVENTEDDEYVLPVNAVIAERTLHRIAAREPTRLVSAFSSIAAGLAPHVNRRAIMLRSPEARLAGRLFDADKIVVPLLGSNADGFYVASQKEWAWNSRYWEQRALLAAQADLDTALQYARHAVAIEFHPHTLTTLGKLLLQQMEREPAGRVGIFSEAFDKLARAIAVEESRSRITVHPYSTLFSGAARFLELGETLDSTQQAELRQHATDARRYFGNDPILRVALNRLDTIL